MFNYYRQIFIRVKIHVSSMYNNNTSIANSVTSKVKHMMKKDEFYFMIINISIYKVNAIQTSNKSLVLTQVL